MLSKVDAVENLPVGLLGLLRRSPTPPAYAFESAKVC